MAQTAIVTGGSSGIGRCLVKQLAEQGYEVISLARRALPDDSFGAPGRVWQIRCDLTDDGQVARAFEAIGARISEAALLFSNAGFGISGPIEDTPIEQVRRQMEVNFTAAVHVIQRAIPLLAAHGDGRIVITSSVAAPIALPYQAFYSCSKAALNTLALALDSELRSQGIRALAVMPGDCATPFTEHRIKNEGDAARYAGCARSVRRMEQDEVGGPSPEVIAAALIRLAHKRHPKPLYGIGAGYRTLLVLNKLLPCRVANAIVRRLYG